MASAAPTSLPRLLLLLVGLAALPPLAGALVPFIGVEIHRPFNFAPHHREWDVLQMVALNTSMAGVIEARGGPLPNITAWRLKEPFHNIFIDAAMTQKIAAELHDEVSAYFVYRQHNNTIGSLLSATVPGQRKPWLQVISNLKTRRLEVIYKVKEDNRTHQVSFPLPRKVGATWTNLLVSMNRTQARLWVNCGAVEKATLDGSVDLRFPPGAVIYFRQEPDLPHHLFGTIQLVKVFNFSMPSRLWRCTFDGLFGPSWKPPMLG